MRHARLDDASEIGRRAPRHSTNQPAAWCGDACASHDVHASTYATMLSLFRRERFLRTPLRSGGCHQPLVDLL